MKSTRKMLEATSKYACFTRYLALCCLVCSCGTERQDQRLPEEKRVSLVRTYHANGKLDEVGAKVDSIDQGYWAWYDTCGILQGECTFVDGKMTGPFNTYYPNGNLKVEAYGVNGVWVGEFVCYYSTGIVMNKATFDSNGELDGVEEEYTEDGVLYEKILWKAGKKVKTFDVR